MIEKITKGNIISGWRKLDYWRRNIKKLYTRVSRIAFGGGKNKNERLIKITFDYIGKAIELSNKT